MGQFAPSEAMLFQCLPGAQPVSHSGLAIGDSPNPNVTVPLMSCKRQRYGSIASCVQGQTVHGDSDGGELADVGA